MGIKEKKKRKSATEAASDFVVTVGGTLTKSANQALGEVSKKAFSYLMDEGLEKLSGGKIESERTKKRRGGNGGGSGSGGGGST